MDGSIVGVASFSRCMFAPESLIYSVYFLGELGGISILLIELILGALILILFIIAPNRYLHPFFCPQVFFVIGLLFVS